MKYIIIAIRDFPEIRDWRGSYFVKSCDSIEEARRIAKLEVWARGGKYGCVIYDITVDDGNEIENFSRFNWSEYKSLDLT